MMLEYDFLNIATFFLIMIFLKLVIKGKRFEDVVR